MPRPPGHVIRSLEASMESQECQFPMKSYHKFTKTIL